MKKEGKIWRGKTYGLTPVESGKSEILNPEKQAQIAAYKVRKNKSKRVFEMFLDEFEKQEKSNVRST